MAQIPYTAPVNGAAEYKAYGTEIWMKDTEGNESHIDNAKTTEKAIIKADKWQQKENKAVLKASKS